MTNFGEIEGFTTDNNLVPVHRALYLPAKLLNPDKTTPATTSLNHFTLSRPPSTTAYALLLPLKLLKAHDADPADDWTDSRLWSPEDDARSNGKLSSSLQWFSAQQGPSRSPYLQKPTQSTIRSSVSVITPEQPPRSVAVSTLEQDAVLNAG